MCRIKDMEVVGSLQGTYSHMAPEVIKDRDFSEVRPRCINSDVHHKRQTWVLSKANRAFWLSCSHGA